MLCTVVNSKQNTNVIRISMNFTILLNFRNYLKKCETRGSVKKLSLKLQKKKLYNKTCVTESLLYKINPNINNPRKIISF